MNNQVILGSLAMDLRRTALGFHRGSITMAKRFADEAKKRVKEVNKQEIKPYVRSLLFNIEKMLSQKDQQKVAEDALMYSTLLQNAARRKTS